MAAQQGHLEVVKLLVEKGAVVDQPHNDGNTALNLASLKGRLEVVDYLLSSTISLPEECLPCLALLREVISMSSNYW
jgi:ankyrin repeat protein